MNSTQKHADAPHAAESHSNYQKYRSGNPAIQRLTSQFLERICAHVIEARPRVLVDLGCGEGLVYEALRKAGYAGSYRGYDLAEDCISFASARHPDAAWKAASLLELLPEGDSPDAILCLEVIEHLPNVDETLRAIRRWAATRTILSVPWEPWFRVGNLIRGARWSTLGNHPEHVQHFSPRSFHKALSRHWPAVDISTSFPWIIAICSFDRDAEPARTQSPVAEREPRG